MVMMDDETIAASLSVIDEKINALHDTLARFTELLDRFLPLIEKYEKSGPMGMLFGNGKTRETVWPTNPK